MFGTVVLPLIFFSSSSSHICIFWWKLLQNLPQSKFFDIESYMFRFFNSFPHWCNVQSMHLLLLTWFSQFACFPSFAVHATIFTSSTEKHQYIRYWTNIFSTLLFLLPCIDLISSVDVSELRALRRGSIKGGIGGSKI